MRKAAWPHLTPQAQSIVAKPIVERNSLFARPEGELYEGSFDSGVKNTEGEWNAALCKGCDSD